MEENKKTEGAGALLKLRNFFEMTSTQFAKEWKALSEEDKTWFKKEAENLQ